MITLPASGASEAFVHPALFYRGQADYLAGVGGFVRTALTADEPVLVAVPGPRLDALREDLGGDTTGVTWTDMTDLGRNPGRILAALQDFADRHEGRPPGSWASRSGPGAHGPRCWRPPVTRR